MGFTLPCPCRCPDCGNVLIQDRETNLCSCSDARHGGYYGCPGLDHVAKMLPLEVAGRLRDEAASLCAEHESVTFRKRGERVEVECE